MGAFTTVCLLIRQKVKLNGSSNCPKSESWESQIDMKSCLTHSPEISETLAGMNICWPQVKKTGLENRVGS